MRKKKLVYDFNTASCLEVEYAQNKWARVTSNEFRSYRGNRRINGLPYEGLTFYLGSNYICEDFTPNNTIANISELNDEALTQKYTIQKIKLDPRVGRRSEKYTQ